MVKKLFILLCGIAASQVALAGGTIDASVSNDSIRLEFDAARVDSNMHISLGGLHDEEGGEVVFAGLHAVDKGRQLENIYIGVGGKLYFFTTDEKDSGALGLGGFLRYSFPQFEGFGVSAHAYYAPDVIAFGGTESLRDLGIRLQYQLIPSARVYVGLRQLAISVEDLDRTVEIDEGLNVGVRIDF